MTPPTRKLIGGVRDSHTKEYLFQISAQTSGCRGRSKFHAQEQQEHETRARTRVFWEKERERKKRCQQGVIVGPRRVCGTARGWAAPPGLLGQGWTPLVSLRCPPMAFYLEIFIFIFLNFSGQLHCGEFFKVQKAAKTFMNLRQNLKQVKLQTQKLRYNK